MTDLLAKAAKIADEVLLPAANEVDRTGRIPKGHFDRLAEDGFYGLIAPVEFGGPGLDFPDFLQIVEILAAACLTTTFTWLQHHGVVMGLSMTQNSALREKYLGPAISGELRGGGAFSGVLPDPPRVRAARVADGWRITGGVPFVSGWGLVDVLHISAFDEESGDVVSGLIDARITKGIAEARRLGLVAADADAGVFEDQLEALAVLLHALAEVAQAAHDQADGDQPDQHRDALGGDQDGRPCVPRQHQGDGAAEVGEQRDHRARHGAQRDPRHHDRQNCQHRGAGAERRPQGGQQAEVTQVAASGHAEAPADRNLARATDHVQAASRQ